MRRRVPRGGRRAVARPSGDEPVAAAESGRSHRLIGPARAKGYTALSASGRAKYADDLLKNTKTLYAKTRTVTFTADQIANGSRGLLDEVVGVAKVVTESFLDPSDPAGRFVAVELAPVRALKQPVSLQTMKANPALSGLEMIRQGRLSVSPVRPAEWAAILKMAGE